MTATLTPAEMLDTLPALTPTQLAYVLQLVDVRGRNKGKPNPRKARELITSGALRLIDPTQPLTRWTVSQAEVRRYIAEGSRLEVAS